MTIREELVQAIEELVAEFDDKSRCASKVPGFYGFEDTAGIELARSVLKRDKKGKERGKL